MSTGIGFFYVLTVQIRNPTGGHEIIRSASGVFDEDDAATENELFSTALVEAAPRLGIENPLKPNGEPNSNKFMVLFYRCVPNDRD